MKFLSALLLAIFVTGCATTQSPATRKTAQAEAAYLTEDGLRTIDLTDIAIVQNNTSTNAVADLNFGLVKEVDEWLAVLLAKEVGGDQAEVISRVYASPYKNGVETYAVISHVKHDTTFNLNIVKNVVTKDRNGKLSSKATSATYEIVAAYKNYLEVVSNPQTQPEGYTVRSSSRSLFGF